MVCSPMWAVSHPTDTQCFITTSPTVQNCYENIEYRLLFRKIFILVRTNYRQKCKHIRTHMVISCLNSKMITESILAKIVKELESRDSNERQMICSSLTLWGPRDTGGWLGEAPRPMRSLLTLAGGSDSWDPYSKVNDYCFPCQKSILLHE